jgi:hypothetical protein
MSAISLSSVETTQSVKPTADCAARIVYPINGTLCSNRQFLFFIRLLPPLAGTTPKTLTSNPSTRGLRMARRSNRSIQASQSMLLYWKRKKRVLAGGGSRKAREAVKAASKRYQKLKRAA